MTFFELNVGLLDPKGTMRFCTGFTPLGTLGNESEFSWGWKSFVEMVTHSNERE